MNFNLVMLSFAIASLVASCGNKDDHGSSNSGGTGNINIKLKSAASAGLTPLADGATCSNPGGRSGSSGSCFTPTAIRGHFNTLEVSGARLKGGGSKYHGLEEVVRTGFFDLSKPVFRW